MDANHQRRTVNITGSGSAPTAQMEPLYRSGHQEVHQHYWPEERGVAARLVNSRSGRTSQPGDPSPNPQGAGTDQPYFLLSNQRVHSLVCDGTRRWGLISPSRRMLSTAPAGGLIPLVPTRFIEVHISSPVSTPVPAGKKTI